MKRTHLIVAAAAVTVTFAGGAVAFAGGSSPSRLDDGKELAGQAGITEAQAIAAARGAASGDLNEIDLEHRDGVLVYNVDVGSKDVKVDAATGKVLAVDADD
ncbi:PepSY domain-containing protein [Solirubrobacter soli]|uniref:PepSY domain-containing protein n=1 Tax=Solirubrobacter soli TaxID=363832 RepID=UPI00055E800B|nr:PepSY domain-containing protein [Solirubrobacter soli]